MEAETRSAAKAHTSRSAGPVGELGFDIERDLLCMADANGYFVSLNAAWERVLGWTRQELRR